MSHFLVVNRKTMFTSPLIKQKTISNSLTFESFGIAQLTKSSLCALPDLLHYGHRRQLTKHALTFTPSFRKKYKTSRKVKMINLKLFDTIYYTDFQCQK